MAAPVTAWEEIAEKKLADVRVERRGAAKRKLERRNDWLAYDVHSWNVDYVRRTFVAVRICAAAGWTDRLNDRPTDSWSD